jgi:hypothetical protein
MWEEDYEIFLGDNGVIEELEEIGQLKNEVGQLKFLMASSVLLIICGLIVNI